MFREITVGAALLAAALAFPAGNVSWAQSNVETINPAVPCLGTADAFGDSCGPAQLHRRDVSCRGARQILRGRGYYHIETMTCGGRYHKFVAWKRGRALLLTVSARSGRIVSIRRLRA